MNKLIRQKNLYRNKYSFATSIQTQTRVQTFEDFYAMKAWITLKRPVFHCIYARANWNPMSEQGDKDLETLANSNQFLQFEFLKFDTERVPKAKKYYSIKCEPEFIILCQGMEMIRQTGSNYTRLQDKLQKTSDFYHKLDIPSFANEFEEYDVQHKNEYREYFGEFDQWTR